MIFPPPGDPIRVLAFGIIGSLLVEVVKVIRLKERGRPIPARYRHRSYYVLRSLLAVGAGILAVAYAVPSDILAIQIGITTPALVDAMTQSSSKLDRDDPPPLP